MHRLFTALALSLIVLTFGHNAFAHTGGASVSGLAAGFGHPFSGLDHILAMIAVGIWASILSGRALWLVPASFVLAMVFGGVVAFSGLGIPAVEIGIVGSVIALGILIAFNVRLPVALGMAAVAVFALFHGHAHGAEMMAGSSGLTYALGFALATSGLHLAGIGLGTLATRASSGRLVPLCGGSIAAAGLTLLVLG